MEKDCNTPRIERTLREDAEEQPARSPEHSADPAGQTPEQLSHMLRVHQVEREIPVEELRKSKIALEESRDQYLDRYEFSPAGYLILNHCNTTGRP